jgi:serine/threonine-protein kinase RsbW
MRWCCLGSDLASGEAVRRFVKSQVETDSVSDQTQFLAQLLATELVTNAVRHSRTSVELGVARRRDRIRIEARDGSRKLPERPEAEAPTRHRGMLLIEDLADRWGVDLEESGSKVVWLELAAAMWGTATALCGTPPAGRNGYRSLPLRSHFCNGPGDDTSCARPGGRARAGRLTSTGRTWCAGKASSPMTGRSGRQGRTARPPAVARR